jgi:hypothetical protein
MKDDRTIPAYVTPEYLEHLTLRHGLGTGKPGDRCSTQEVRAWLDLDPSTDACPPCAEPLIWSLVIRVQDRRDEWREAMPPLLPKLAGSKGSDALSLRRLYRCADWQIRELLPAIMETWPELKEEAAQLRAVKPVINRQTAKLAADQIDLAHALALDLDLASARDLAVARDLARALALAIDYDLALAIALALDLDLALDLARARAIARALDLASARALARALAGKLSPVALIAELLDMQEAQEDSP